jgi:hypothetical protein
VHPDTGPVAQPDAAVTAEGSIDAAVETKASLPDAWVGTWNASMSFYASAGGDDFGDNGIRRRSVTMSIDTEGNVSFAIEHRSPTGPTDATKCTMQAKLRDGMLEDASSGCRAMFAFPARTRVELLAPCRLRLADLASPAGTMLFQLEKHDCTSASDAH